MKTIKLLHYAKYPVLLLIAFLGILIGGQQNAPRQLADIGGNGAGSTAPRNFVSNNDAEIGGGQNAPKSPLMSGNEIGGAQSPPRPYTVANIGGIGGGQTAPRPVEGLNAEIGGSQTAPRGFHKSSDPIGGQAVPRNFAGKIGGNSVPRSYAYHCMEIGCGGNETRKIFSNAISDLASVDDLECGVQHADQPSYLPTANSPLRYSVYDFSDIGSTFEIGGQTTPGSETRRFVSGEIGGGQTAPRQLEIGGQTVPSTRPLMLAYVENPVGNYVPSVASLINGFPDIGGAQGAPRQ